MFGRPGESHSHSLQVLNALYEYDDFMLSIDTLVDLGCGTGEDLEWWATRTTRDDNPEPLNIRCTGVDLLPTLSIAHKYNNINYQCTDFEKEIYPPKGTKFDVLWCHDAFQYCINPIQTLINWRNITNDDGMLAIILPQTTNIARNKPDISQPNGCYYHHTLISLIHMLAVSGWDCRAGFFLKRPSDPWLHAVVYKSKHDPMNPQTTTWYELAEKKLLPETANKSVQAHGYVRQNELILPWIDKSLMHMGQQ